MNIGSWIGAGRSGAHRLLSSPLFPVSYALISAVPRGLCRTSPLFPVSYASHCRLPPRPMPPISDVPRVLRLSFPMFPVSYSPHRRCSPCPMPLISDVPRVLFLSSPLLPVSYAWHFRCSPRNVRCSPRPIFPAPWQSCRGKTYPVGILAVSDRYREIV